MKKALILGLLAAGLMGASAYAEAPAAASAPGGPGPEKREAFKAEREEKMKKHLAEVDAKGDGKIDKAEFLAQAEKRFQKMDANGDGVISEDERKAMHKGPPGGWHGKKPGGEAPAVP